MLAQRLGSTTQKDPEFIDALIEKINQNKNSCDEVWLATDYGFPTLEKHRENTDILIGVAEKFRKNGIKVSLQISNTIGHGEYMSAEDCSGLVYEGSPVGKMVGADGTQAGYCFCPNDGFFKEYVRAFVKEYSRIKPDCIWIDDDLRMTNHKPVDHGCFCPSCLCRFNKKHGSTFTREELVQEINFGNKQWREKFVEYQREVLYDLTYLISSAVHEVSPETVMGLQYGPNRGYTGNGSSNILDAMRDATGKTPKTRPGGGAYDDYDPNAFIVKSHYLDRQNYMLPDYVEEKCPEIENLPDVQFGKTIAGTCFETTFYFASGNTSMSYAMLMNDYEPMEWHGKMLGAFSEHYEYWKKLGEYSKNTAQAGIVIAQSNKAYLADSIKPFDWSIEPSCAGRELEKCAIPTACSHDKTSTFFLHYKWACKMTNAELEELFDKPVITDAETLEMLCGKGYHFGAAAKQISVTRLFTRFSDHECNNGFVGRKWANPFGNSSSYKLIDNNGKTQPLEVYDSDVEGTEDIGETASALITTPEGALWAVFANFLWNPIISSEKREQILNTAEYLNPGRMTARLITPAKVIVLPRENSEGLLTSVSLTNCTTAKTNELILKIRRPVGNTVKFMSQYNGSCDLKLLPSPDGDGFAMHIPKIDAYSTATVFFQ